ncbi:hypothetical protein CMU87_14275 [Elizabethkingia anophelis]|nr:hypothetical protein [Elizabethkingia anophelis]
MAALIRGGASYFHNNEKDQKVLEYTDKLLLICPDFKNFTFSHLLMTSYFDDLERRKIQSVITEIRNILEEEGFIKYDRNSNNWYILTDKGRLAKSKGGYFKYLKSIRHKKDWYKIIPIILTFIFGSLSVCFYILNYNLSIRKDKSTQQNKFLKKENDSLRRIITSKNTKKNR